MYDTTYTRAKDASDAAKKMRAAEDGQFIAGGHTLLPTMKQRLAAPSDLIDISHIKGMADISVSRKDVTIGAAATHASVANHSKLMKVCPSLCELASHIGDPAVRNRGTIGGSIANNDPAADYPAAMVALGATIVTNKRKIRADRFFTGMFETSLKEDEVIKAVTFKAPKSGAYAKFPNPASRYAMAGVYVADHGKKDIRVGVTGASSGGVYRAKNMEKALAKDFSADAIDGCKVDEGDMLSDIHGSAAYRANLVKVMAKRAIAAAG
ncbi:MAG: carbon monoxide dehydrogenase [Rhizobiaceae bacterium]|nr:carbon monoxide dehydrogenase [Rhizobiaceae bacterium]